MISDNDDVDFMCDLLRRGITK